MLENPIPKYQRVKEIIRSRILNNEYGQDCRMPSEHDFVHEFNVSRQTVLKALSELMNEGLVYKKQGKGTFAAKTERTLKKQIGIIVYRSDNTYYSKIIRGVENFLTENGFSSVLCNSEGSPSNENAHINRIFDTVDGFVICPVIINSTYTMGLKMLQESGVPYVLVGNIIQSASFTEMSDYVVSDNCLGGFMAGRHLLDSGYKNIIFMTSKGGMSSDFVRERVRGLKFALAERGICFDDENSIVETSDKDPDNAYESDAYAAADEIVSKMRAGSRTGIFVSGDYMGIGLLRGLREKGVKIPEDVGICGYDDIELARQWGIELTTIRQEKTLIGKTAAEILLKRIQKTSAAESRHVIVPVALMQRKTT